MKLSKLCIECGEEEDLHSHVFSPVSVPDTCQCNPAEWIDPRNIDEPCVKPEIEPDTELCTHCNHPLECHPQPQALVT